MVAVMVAAVVPTRERQLYLYECSPDDGLVTRVSGRTIKPADTSDTALRDDPYRLGECLGDRGLFAGNVLSPEDEFADVPRYAISRVIQGSGAQLNALDRASQGSPARSGNSGGAEPNAFVSPLANGPADSGPFTPETAGEGGSTPVQLASFDPGATSGFPGGLVTSPIGAGPGGGGGGFVGGPPTGGSSGGGSSGGGDGDPGVPPIVPVVPEPGTWLMMLLGFFGLGAAMRRRPVSSSFDAPLPR